MWSFSSLTFRSSRLCKMLLFRSKRSRQGSVISAAAGDAPSVSLPSPFPPFSSPPSRCAAAIAGAAPRTPDLCAPFDASGRLCSVSPDGGIQVMVLVLLSSIVATELPPPPVETLAWREAPR